MLQFEKSKSIVERYIVKINPLHSSFRAPAVKCWELRKTIHDNFVREINQIYQTGNMADSFLRFLAEVADELPSFLSYMKVNYFG